MKDGTLLAEDFAEGQLPAAEGLHVADPVQVNDPNPGDAVAAETPLFSSGGVTVFGTCADNLEGTGQDEAIVTVRYGAGGAFSSITNNGSWTEATGGSEVNPVGISSASNELKSAYFVAVSTTGVLSGSFSVEVNDTTGTGSDCTFAGNGARLANARTCRNSGREESDTRTKVLVQDVASSSLLPQGRVARSIGMSVSTT